MIPVRRAHRWDKDRCAAGVDCTAPFTDCVGATNTCRSCGGLGQRCCTGLTGGDYCAQPFACDLTRRCAACGAAGQTCCPGDVCNTGLGCGVASLCATCGGMNQPCCAGGTCTGQLACGNNGRCN